MPRPHPASPRSPDSTDSTPIAIPFPPSSPRPPPLPPKQHQTRPATASASISPWLLPDVTSPAFSASSIQRGLPSPNLTFGPRSHSRSGSSSGDHPAHALGRLSFRPPSRKLYPESDIINQQLDIKRLLSKPAATVTSHSSRSTDEKSFHYPRRAASSDNPARTWKVKPSLADHPLPTFNSSISSPGPTDLPHFPETHIAHTSHTQTRTDQKKPTNNVLRRKNSNKMPRSLPTSPSHIYPFHDVPVLPPKPASRPLTPAASIAKAYRDSERRRELLAKEASSSESPKSPFSDSPTSSDSKPSTPSTSHADAFPISTSSSLNRGSSFKLSLGHYSHSTARKSPRPTYTEKEKPSLRILTDAPRSHTQPLARRPSTATDTIPSSILSTPGRKYQFPSLGGGYDASPSTSATSKDTGTRFWSLVRRMSHSVLKERAQEPASRPLLVPPVPDTLPSNIVRTHSQQSTTQRDRTRPSERPSNSTPLASRADPRLERATSSYPSNDLSCHIVALSSRRSSISSYGSTTMRKSTEPRGVDVDISGSKRASTSLDVNGNGPTLGRTPPSVISGSEVPDHLESGAASMHRDDTRPDHEPTEPIAPVQNQDPSLSPRRELGAHKELKDRFWAAFTPRKSVDVTRLPILSKDPHYQLRRRTKSLDKDAPPKTAVVTFRELGKPPKSLTEKERNDRWEELLLRSDRAGGTIHATVTPLSLRSLATPSK